MTLLFLPLLTFFKMYFWAQDDSGKEAEKYDVDGAYAPRMFFIGMTFF